MISTGPLFEVNYNSTSKINVNQGGTSSGKTYTILQVLFILAIKEPKSVITVVGQSIPNLKRGALRDAKMIIATTPDIGNMIKDFNKTDRIFYLSNGSIIEFTSYNNDVQNAKNGKRDYLFVNEANGITYELYFQLAIRTKTKIFIDYNPSAKFWVHDRLIGRDDVSLFISDHRHNPFLSQEMHDEIESIEDKELFKVYARGLTGKITGLIYPNYKLTDSMPEFLEPCYGLDFGCNNPSALVEVREWTEEKVLYWNELIYESHLPMGNLIEKLYELGISKSAIIYCDSASPEKIEEIRLAGFNARKAKKDVINGINYCKYRKIFITDNSTNLIKEINRYKWKEDNGVNKDEPVKFMDHALDAARYGSYSNKGGDNKAKVIDTSYSNIFNF